jgi:hypothetical protein
MRNIPHNILESFLSSDRLGGYLRIAGGNHAKAVELYLENLNQCQIFYTRLHWLEVGLRNAMSKQLSFKYGAEWYDNPHAGLEYIEQQQILKAKDMLEKDSKPINNSNLVAALNFGLWVNLLNSPYENLWRLCLRKAFAGHTATLQRKEIRKLLHPMLKLRNRIAHYEPILGYDLPKAEKDIVDIVRWIEPTIVELP